MALEDMTETGGLRTVLELEYVEDFNAKWRQYTPDEQAAINAEINARLDELVATPDARWPVITNTSIEGGRVNPFNGKRGDWTGTPYHAIWVRSGRDDRRAALFFGQIWKKRIIEHKEDWIGYRSDGVTRQTFPNKGISLDGKSYFVRRDRRK